MDSITIYNILIDICILYNVQCTLYTVQSSLYNTHIYIYIYIYIYIHIIGIYVNNELIIYIIEIQIVNKILDKHI